MVAHIHHCIEQLDLAAEQLRKADSAYARLALILIDNVVELRLHRYAEQEMKWYETFWRLGKGKYTEEEREKVLGQHFEEKPKFARRMGLISDDELTFILICHRYRNELYHRGIMHESVIHEIAWHYHDIACQLLPRLRLGSYRWKLGDTVSEVVKKYCGDKGLDLMSVEKQLPLVSRRLAEARPETRQSLAQSLSASALTRIEAMDNAIEFLVHNSPEKTTRGDVIFDVQARPYLFTQEVKGTLPLQPGEKIETFDDALRLLKRYWSPPVRSDPVPRWRGRAERLRGEKCSLKALKKYQCLMDEMDYFDEKVRDATRVLDQHIEEEIDRLREK